MQARNAAEEPVTARIHRRQEEAAEVQQAETKSSPADHAELGHEPRMTFQERIELEHQPPRYAGDPLPASRQATGERDHNYFDNCEA